MWFHTKGHRVNVSKSNSQNILALKVAAWGCKMKRKNRFRRGHVVTVAFADHLQGFHEAP